MTTNAEELETTKKRKKLLNISTFLSPLPILLGLAVCYVWKGNAQDKALGPIVAIGYVLMAALFWINGSPKKKASKN